MFNKVNQGFFGLLLVSALAVVGCKQDPLDGFDKSVKEALPPNSKTDPDLSNKVLIDVNNLYDVREGEELSFRLSGRVLLPNSTFTLSIRNESSFPGIVFDQASSTVTWKVPENFVRGDDYDVIPMVIMLTTNEAPFLYDQKTVQISVFRNIARPTIESHDPLDKMTEGGVQDFDVIVRSEDEADKPQLLVLPLNNRTSLASFISTQWGPYQDKSDPSLWRFTVRIDLGDAELTSTYEDFNFGLQAVSSLGRISQVKELEIRVTTSVSAPVVTWNSSVIEFNSGEKSVFSFSAYDPKGEGDIRLDQTQLCAPLPGATCNCVARSGGSELFCQISWAPTAPGRYYIDTDIYNDIRIAGSVVSESLALSRTIVVKGTTP
jgi:hypothetical protein